MPQFGRRSIVEIDPVNVRIGLTLLAIGLAKKVLIADAFAGYASPVFEAASAGSMPGTALAWIGVVAYGLQLYFDFSAYSDMAIGISLLFNVRLPVNFDSPYQATSVIDFWRRWHMTLSRFLRDYLYIPMGGNRRGIVRQNLNILVTMLLGGLWHGANWTFVLWGAIHGVLVVVNHAIRAASGRFAPAMETAAFRGIARVATLLMVFLAWVPFRADSIHAALVLWRSMLLGAGVPSFGAAVSSDVFASMTNRFAPVYGEFGGTGTPLAFALLLLLAVVMLAGPPSQAIAGYDATGRRADPAGVGARHRFVSGIAVGLLLFFGIRGLGQLPSEFLYFQF
jgi:D-alanyl-lipoteichoic acid acyltransferase DltB (MBOAT superfamily)